MANLKNEFFSKNEIITSSVTKQTDWIEKSKFYATLEKSLHKDKHQPKITTRKFKEKWNPAKPSIQITTSRM